MCDSMNEIISINVQIPESILNCVPKHERLLLNLFHPQSKLESGSVTVAFDHELNETVNRSWISLSFLVIAFCKKYPSLVVTDFSKTHTN